MESIIEAVDRAAGLEERVLNILRTTREQILTVIAYPENPETMKMLAKLRETERESLDILNQLRGIFPAFTVREVPA